MSAIARPRIASARPRAVLAHAADLRVVLASFDMLADLPAELLDAVVASCPVRRVPQGEAVIRAGVQQSEMYLLVAGELRVHLGERLDAPVAILRSGDTAGELSTLDRRPASATVIAHVESSLLVLDETMFWRLVHASHGFAVRLLLKLSERLRANNQTVQANMELCARLESVVLTDALTSVCSRRWLDETLPRLCERHRADGRPLSVAIVDVDHFKKVNDTFGHPAGDKVLIEIARTVRGRLRPSDYIARMGGEEFVIILPATPLVGARIASERVREAVAAIRMQPAAELPPKVTVSIGLAQLGEAADPKNLLAQADAALYRAKRGGRNRVEA